MTGDMCTSTCVHATCSTAVAAWGNSAGLPFQSSQRALCSPRGVVFSHPGGVKTPPAVQHLTVEHCGNCLGAGHLSVAKSTPVRAALRHHMGNMMSWDGLSVEFGWEHFK